ncbi:MAG: M20/M25/M40 family metallo-hydrolase [Nanoarchaeota archaeon]|nr:M20/M25/M40 family metallo-hydrolase [Nanoarchaeota archaeon]
MMVVKLARDLLKIPSPSGEEKKLGEFLVKRLEKNFVVKTQKVGDRFNVLATIGTPNLLLTTHLDTVPEQLRLREDGKWLYGRGACDAKGIIASMIVAAEKAVKAGLKDFGLLFDVSEESDFSGINKALKIVNPKFVIVGEPTNFRIVKGQKGLLGIKIQCLGKSAPGSTPKKGISAINKILNLLSKINSIKLPNEKFLGETTLNIGKIKGGSAANVVADYAEAIIELRTTKPNKEVLNLIYKYLPEKNVNVEYSFEPVKVKEIDWVKEFKLKEIVVPYFTEMYFWTKKAKAIVFGPGEYKYAHSSNERIRKSDLIKGSEIYFKMIKRFA